MRIRMRTSVLHCFETYLHTTENWVFRLIKNQSDTIRLVAALRFLQCDFIAPDIEMLRSHLQLFLKESERPAGLSRLILAASVLTYPAYLRVALHQRRVDIVHSHFAHVAWRYRKLPLHCCAGHVVSFYGWDYVRLSRQNPVWSMRLRTLYDMADCFLCEGPYGAAQLARQGCPDRKIRVAPLGVELAAIPFFHRDKKHGQLRLLQIASFREKKGHIDTVNAFAMALSEHPEMHLTLLGASLGEIYDQVIAAIRRHGIEDKVTLRPSVPFADLHKAMRDSHIFIHPSRHARDGDCEGGAPVVLLDAQATGMPVIATTHCDIPQEVVDGKTGLLCGEADAPALAAAIERFCDMGQGEFDRFAYAAREHVERNFDARVCARRVEDIYRELIAMRGSGRA